MLSEVCFGAGVNARKVVLFIILDATVEIVSGKGFNSDEGLF